jgi:gamma-butyrobetaine dioxygenase
MTDPVAFLIDLLNQRGSGAYLGESVTQREHALQSALLAESAGAAAPLIVAALLHDIGHILGPGDDGLPPDDDEHESAAARWLARWFPTEVTEPIRLHVAAKRYLCAVAPGYLERLSPASQHSLRLQGGVFTLDEATAFAAGLHAEAARQLRQWDDAAKIPGLPTPDPEHYRPLLALVRCG